jgi:hypothetical protein
VLKVASRGFHFVHRDTPEHMEDTIDREKAKNLAS